MWYNIDSRERENNPCTGEIEIDMDDVWNGFDDYIEEFCCGDEFNLVIDS